MAPTHKGSVRQGGRESHVAMQTRAQREGLMLMPHSMSGVVLTGIVDK